MQARKRGRPTGAGRSIISASVSQPLDVLIIGAGLSGVGAASRIRREFPNKSLVLLEAREDLGGTWDLFRYPGIRCDTDMYTLGYDFEPFPGNKSIAGGEEILSYIREAARKYGVLERIRYDHRVVSIAWDSAAGLWTVTARLGDGEARVFQCRFLHCCSGYFSYSNGYRPEFAGEADFKGTIVHPQNWPQDLDYEGKRVVVIGSGATAVTLVPNLARKAAHVTMLQRSPSYVVSLPSEDAFNKSVSRFLPRRWAYALTRWKQIGMAMLLLNKCKTDPDKVRAALRQHAVDMLGAKYPVDTHFKPAYNPFEQRVCFMPDGDMFRTLRKGQAEIVTDKVARFNSGGIELASGEMLEADIIVTATGLELLPLAGLTPVVDGTPMPVNEAFVYKGMMLSGVPNFAFVVGYTALPWTLKADMVNRYVCRLIRYMDRKGYRKCTPSLSGIEMAPTSLMDISSGYAARAADQLPRQGDRTPWKLYQHYLRDRFKLFGGKLNDDAMSFS
ncbi:flavin-containing monooxygenase [Brevundimonas sp. SL161]|uniref:flavin-containing monooxygenase n=1 Tax=Brevundimonas sp. SL161 TaxID=2804613 RepID=UPI003CF5AD8F